MLSRHELCDKAGWFARPGADYDVAVSSRVRLSRNLSILPFPRHAGEEERMEVVEGVVESVSNTDDGDRFARIDIDTCDQAVLGLLVERNLISDWRSELSGRTLIVRDDQEIGVSVNDVDHIRVMAFQPGRSVAEAYEYALALDSGLEALLPYAVSPDLGYLTTEIRNLGTGMRGSVMLHLLGLAETGGLEGAFQGLRETGISVRGFKRRDSGSLGDMFQIVNQVTLGVSEQEILANLEAATQQLVHYERQARSELARRGAVEDRVHRAYGLLAYARRLTDVEAIGELSWLRFGVAMRIINSVELADATSLFFLSQKSNVAVSASDAGCAAGNLDERRAWIIRQCLGAAHE